MNTTQAQVAANKELPTSSLDKPAFLSLRQNGSGTHHPYTTGHPHVFILVARLESISAGEQMSILKSGKQRTCLPPSAAPIRRSVKLVSLREATTAVL
jgi:hypothetical protein